MFHPSRQGIYCDLCGAEVLAQRDKVEYYSINMKKVTVHKNLPKDIDDVLDIDFCENCYLRMRERVLKVAEINNQKREEYARKHT